MADYTWCQKCAIVMSNSVNNRHLTHSAQNMPIGKQDLAKHGHNRIIPLRAAHGAVFLQGEQGCINALISGI